MRGYINITELSKIKKITTETLRHYDRIGLFQPDFTDPDTRYRYYSYEQCERIGTILELRNLGMSLLEIKDFMKNRDVKRSLQLLQEKEAELEREIREKKWIKKIIRQKLNYIEQLPEMDLEQKPELCLLKKREVVTVGKYEEYKGDYLFDVMNLERHLKEIAPVFASDLVGSIIKKESFLDPGRKIFSRMAYLPADKCNRNEIMFHEIPGGEYLCGKGRGRFQYGCHAAGVIMDWLMAEGYEICGDIIEYDEVDLSITNLEEELSFVYQVPVKKLEK